MRALWALALLSAVCLCGQTEHKDKATDYPVHAMAGKVAIGADYLVHSIPAGDQMLLARDYLVVEVAEFPAPGEPVGIDGNTFALRLNGKKPPLPSDSPGFVVASIKYPDWQSPHPHAEASAGSSTGGGVVLGAPPTVGRFPDDPTATQVPVPRAPSPEEQNGIEQQPPKSVEEIINGSALVEGRADHPVSGFLYFPYRGKIKSLKSIELIYQSKDGSATLKLL